MFLFLSLLSAAHWGSSFFGPLGPGSCAAWGGPPGRTGPAAIAGAPPRRPGPPPCTPHRGRGLATLAGAGLRGRRDRAGRRGPTGLVPCGRHGGRLCMIGLMLAPVIGAILAGLIHSQVDWAAPDTPEEAWRDLQELARRQSPPAPEDDAPRRSPPTEGQGRAAPAGGKGRTPPTPPSPPPAGGKGRQKPPAPKPPPPTAEASPAPPPPEVPVEREAPPPPAAGKEEAEEDEETEAFGDARWSSRRRTEQARRRAGRSQEEALRGTGGGAGC